MVDLIIARRFTADVPAGTAGAGLTTVGRRHHGGGQEQGYDQDMSELAHRTTYLLSIKQASSYIGAQRRVVAAALAAAV